MIRNVFTAVVFWVVMTVIFAAVAGCAGADPRADAVCVVDGGKVNCVRVAPALPTLIDTRPIIR